MCKGVILIIAMALYAVFGSIIAAAQEQKPDSAKQSIYSHGKWGLQAQTSIPFSNDYPDHMYIIIKRFSGPNTAWRLGLNLRDNNEQGNRKFSNYAYPDSLGEIDTTTTRSNGTRDILEIETVLQRVKYNSVKSNIGFYWGLGPEFKFSRDDTREYATGQSYYYSRRQYSNITAGLCGLIGAEYYPIKRIGISIEYSLSAYYYHYDQKMQTNYDSDNLQGKSRIYGDGFELHNSTAECGVTFYF